MEILETEGDFKGPGAPVVEIKGPVLRPNHQHQGLSRGEEGRGYGTEETEGNNNKNGRRASS